MAEAIYKARANLAWLVATAGVSASPAAVLDASGIGARPDELRVKAQHFLDIGRVRIKRLAQRLVGQDIGLVESVEVMHDAFAYSPIGIAQTHDRSGANLAARNAARVSCGMFLSHVGLLISATLSGPPPRGLRARRADAAPKAQGRYHEMVDSRVQAHAPGDRDRARAIGRAAVDDAILHPTAGFYAVNDLTPYPREGSAWGG
jgi:hypothetical protein